MASTKEEVCPTYLMASLMQTNLSAVQDPFEEIFQEHWGRVIRLLVRLTGDEAEAEDIALEVFIRLYHQSFRWDREANIGGWLTTTAVHLGLNAIRSRKRRQGYEFASGLQALEETDPMNPLDELIQKESQQQVRAVLGQMDQRQAQILVLRYSGFSYKEIAEMVGVSASSVGSLLNRAEKVFLKRAKQHGQGGER